MIDNLVGAGRAAVMIVMRCATHQKCVITKVIIMINEMDLMRNYIMTSVPIRTQFFYITKEKSH